MARLRRAQPRPAGGLVVQGATTTELPDEVVAAYEAPFPTRSRKAGAPQFPLLVPTEEDAPGAAEMLAVIEALRGWDKPALVAFSDSDPVFPYPRAGERVHGLIPGAGEQVRIEGAAHFLQEDRGDVIADAILGGVRDRRQPDGGRAGRPAVRGGRRRSPAGDGDGPVVMLNLNRYRERARYDERRAGRRVRRTSSGREAYLRYGAVASAVLARVGGRILWHTDSKRHRDRRRLGGATTR